VVEGQRIPQQFVPNVASDIVDIAAVPPPNRFNAIIHEVRQLVQLAAGLSSSFGINLSEEVRRRRAGREKKAYFMMSTS